MGIKSLSDKKPTVGWLYCVTIISVLSLKELFQKEHHGRRNELFENEILRKRPYLTIDMCRMVIQNNIKKEVQTGGRIRFWGKVEELEGRYLRVVTLEDGFTIHNAFIDRGFKP
jgi:hypothetical protein